MKLKIYNCAGENYSQSAIDGELKKQLLYLPHDKLEVTYSLSPQIDGHSDGKFNILFLDDNKDLPENERKYFTNVNWIQRQKIRFMYGDLIFQSREFKLSVSSGFIGFILGIISQRIMGC